MASQIGWSLDVALLVLPTLVHIWSTNLSRISVVLSAAADYCAVQQVGYLGVRSIHTGF